MRVHTSRRGSTQQRERRKRGEALKRRRQHLRGGLIIRNVAQRISISTINPRYSLPISVNMFVRVPPSAAYVVCLHLRSSCTSYPIQTNRNVERIRSIYEFTKSIRERVTREVRRRSVDAEITPLS